jgi:hypothetical protein
MKRHLFLRVLLSLLLLLSQQMAISHAMSHWAGTADKSAQVELESAQNPSKDGVDGHACPECLAYAQLASAVSSPVFALPVSGVQPSHLTLFVPSADCIRTVCVFRSRAPPQA